MTTGGEDALTALSLAFPVQLFMVAVSIGTGVGTNALLAKLLGLGDRGSANRTVGNAQTLAIILSAVFIQPAGRAALCVLAERRRQHQPGSAGHGH